MVDAQLRELERVVAESPGDARAWVRLGRALRLADRRQEARVAFGRARAADPLDLEACTEVDPSVAEVGSMRPVAMPATGSVATTVAAFSADGRLLAAGGTASRVVVLSTRPWMEVAVLEGAPQPLTALAFSPDGRWLAGSGAEGEVGFWLVEAMDAAARHSPVEEEWRHRVDGSVADLAWLPNGRQLAVAGARLSLIDVPNREVGSELPASQQDTHWNAVAAAPRHGRSGFQVALAGADGRVVLYDPDSGYAEAPQPDHAGEVTSVTFSGDGAVLVSGDTEAGVAVWDGERNELALRATLAEPSTFQRQVAPLVMTAGLLGPRSADGLGGIVDVSLTWHAGFVAVTTGCGHIHVLQLQADGLSEVCRHSGSAHFLGTLCWNRRGTLLAAARGGLSILGVASEPQAPEVNGGFGPAGIECDVPPPTDEWLV